VLGSDGRVLAKGLCGDQVRLRGLLEAADLRDVAQSLTTLQQPVRITPRNPADAARVSAVGAASNGVEGNER
jgi:hypothetical protein